MLEQSNIRVILTHTQESKRIYETITQIQTMASSKNLVATLIAVFAVSAVFVDVAQGNLINRLLGRPEQTPSIACRSAHYCGAVRQRN